MTKYLGLMAGVLLLASSAYASHDSSTGLKSWYMNFGLGYAGPSYSKNPNLQSFVNQEKGTAGETELPMSVEISVYWPVGTQVLLGLTDTGFSDTYSSATAGTSASGAVVASNLMVGAEYFPLSDRVAGLFLRADVGYGAVGTTTGFSFFPSSSQSALALHGGAGLAIPMGRVRMPIFAGYYYENLSSGAVSAIQIALSVMF